MGNPIDAPRLQARRSFLIGGAVSLAAFSLGCSRDSAAAAAKPLPGKVQLVEFDNAGKRLREATVPTVVKTDAQWRQQLSPLAFDVTRRDGTERAFTGALLNEKRKGVFRCACCGTALFDSATKYESGTGWPSFWQPIARQNVAESSDRTLGMVRTEVSCRRCDGHLGHVFDDGPRPTGLRYCMNSVSLAFAKA